LPNSLIPAEGYAGQLALGEITWLPSDNHLSHMTGTLYYYFKGVAPDTSIPIADNLKLTITLVYEGWSSLAPSPPRTTSVTSKVETKKS